MGNQIRLSRAKLTGSLWPRFAGALTGTLKVNEKARRAVEVYAFDRTTRESLIMHRYSAINLINT